MASVQLQKVQKFFGDTHVVVGLDLMIEDGEFAVLVGPSGCGKSTTLRMIAGLEEITSGDLHIGTRRCNDLSPRDRDIAMVFQSYALYPHMTVRQNMAFGLVIRKVAQPEIDRRVGEAAALLGLTELLDRRPKALSGGQRQRVAMGRAVVREPSVFLFDEPLSNLDAKLRVQMRLEVARLHKRLGATIVYVTHDQVEAMTLADRIAIMRLGELQQFASPSTVYSRPANTFVATFIGSPAMNLFAVSADMTAGDAVLSGDKARLRCSAEQTATLEAGSGQGGNFVLGVRPQHLTPCAPDDADLQFEVDVVEPLGAETFVYSRADQTDATGLDAATAERLQAPLVVRVAAGTSVRPGEYIHLKIDRAHAHLFGEDGNRLNTRDA